MINEMGVEDLKALLLQVTRRIPEAVFDILDKARQASPSPGPSPPSPSSTSWCLCGNCREMQTQDERVCCKLKPQNCLSSRPVSIFVKNIPFSMIFLSLKTTYFPNCCLDPDHNIYCKQKISSLLKIHINLPNTIDKCYQQIWYFNKAPWKHSYLTFPLTGNGLALTTKKYYGGQMSSHQFFLCTCYKTSFQAM